MTPHRDPAPSSELDGPPARNRVFTLPNVICFVRLAASPLLIALAAFGHPQAFLAFYILLALSDWVDGKLAIWLDQRSSFGARLDSVADVTLYACLLIGSVILASGIIRQEAPWIGIAVGSYVVSALVGWRKFRRFPTYHTRGAKTAWLMILISAWFVFTGRSVWMLRIAMLAVTLVNAEAVLMTRLLPEWRADVPSLWHARQLKRQHDAESMPSEIGEST